MQVEIHKNRNYIRVIREEGDRKISGGSWGSKESQLFYHVKNEMEKQHGIPLVKIRAQKDGHLFGDEATPILRPPKPRNINKILPAYLNIGVYYGAWMLRCPADVYNRDGEVCLDILPEYWLPEYPKVSKEAD